jgi:import inner membrane translocase subunit TIM10
MDRFFGSSAPPQQTGPSALFAAKTEMEMYTDLFNRMSAACYKKCIPKQNDPDLSVGEMACTDRCVGKYMDAHERVGKVMQKVGEGMQAQQEALNAIQQAKR